MNTLLEECNQYAINWKMEFNQSKSVFINYGSKIVNRHVLMRNMILFNYCSDSKDKNINTFHKFFSYICNIQIIKLI